MTTSFDSYYHWLGIPPRDQPPNHYRLLGIERFEENLDVISVTSDRQMAHVRTFQSGPHAGESQTLLNELARAAGSLLDAQRKEGYDARLKQQLAAESVGSREICATGTSTFGEYLLLERLGGNSMGDVFKAEHQKMNRTVALKLLSRQTSQSSGLLERFHRKVRILANLSHPNLVMAYDAGEQDNTHYLATEFIEGTDLHWLGKHYGALPVQHVVDYALQAASGLSHAHSRHVFHRNVKPSNLLLDRQGVIKVIGLGVARVDVEVDSGPDLTKTGQALGTYDYMAPEQAVDPRAADHRADIYSLGCTMFKLLTGRALYPDKSPLRKVRAHAEAPIPSVSQIRLQVPTWLNLALHRMLAKQPQQRFQSMDEVIGAIERQ